MLLDELLAAHSMNDRRLQLARKAIPGRTTTETPLRESAVFRESRYRLTWLQRRKTGVNAEATLGQVRLIEVRNGANKILGLQTGGRISAIALSADSRSLVTADERGSIQFWEVSTGHLTNSFETGQVITALAVDISCQTLAAATADRWIGLWSVVTGALKIELKNIGMWYVHSPPVRMAGRSPAEATIEINSMGTRVRQGNADR